MTDTILRGTGNSRTLRTVANALTLYPTHEAMIQAMVNGTFPIDIGSLSSAGLTRRGTDLNKANILTDSTAAGMGLTSSATPNDAFSKLRALVKAAQDDADTALDTGVSFMTGSYVGTGLSGEEHQVTIQMPRKWRLFSIENGIITQGFEFLVKLSGNGQMGIISTIMAKKTDLTLSYWATDRNPSSQFNRATVTYHWWAI